jgi:hypothetical protein
MKNSLVQSNITYSTVNPLHFVISSLFLQDLHRIPCLVPFSAGLRVRCVFSTMVWFPSWLDTEVSSEELQQVDVIRVWGPSLNLRQPAQAHTHGHNTRMVIVFCFFCRNNKPLCQILSGDTMWSLPLDSWRLQLIGDYNWWPLQ